MLSDFKTYCKATVINWCGIGKRKDKIDQWIKTGKK